MRVSYVQFVPLPSRFAAPIQILNTARELATLGVTTTVYSGPLLTDVESCLAFYGLSPNPKLEIRPLVSRLPRWRDLPWRLGRVLADQETTEPHIVLSREETAITVYPLFRRRRLPNTRFIYEAHRLCFAHLAERRTGRRWREGDQLPWGVRRLRRREEAVVNGADAIVCLTEGVSEALAHCFRPTQPLLVLPSGVSFPAEPPRPPVAAERDIDLLYAGKLEPRKGLPQLLDAMRHLPGRRLWVLGGGPDEIAACRALAAQIGLAHRVEFVGFVPHGRLGAYLARARVGVCPLSGASSITSECFTSPLKLLEFMAQGIPVVASDLPSVRAIATHEENALLVPPDEPVALADGIRRLLSDPELAKRLADAARYRAAEFSWQARAHRLLEFFERVSSGLPNFATEWDNGSDRVGT